MNLSIWASKTDALTTTAGSASATASSGSGIAVGDAINSVLVPEGSTIGALSGTTITLAFPVQTYQGQTAAGYPQITGLPVTAGLLGATVTGAGIPASTTVLQVLVAAVPATNLSPGQSGTVLLSHAVTSAPNTSLTYQPFEFAPTGNAVLASGTDSAATFTGSAIEYVGSVQLERSFDGGATFIIWSEDRTGTMAIYAAGTPVSYSFGEPEKGVLYRLNATAYTSTSTITIHYRISQTGGAAESLNVGQLI